MKLSRFFYFATFLFFSFFSHTAFASTFTLNGVTYLSFDVLKDLTYQETVDATSAGGAYTNYHIANADEALSLYNAIATTTATQTNGVSDMFRDTTVHWGNGTYGDNFNNFSDAVFYKGDLGAAGYLLFDPQYIEYCDTCRTYEATDQWAKGGLYEDTPVSWLLIQDTPSAVPVPAAIWLMGSGLLGLIGFSRQKKTQSVAA